MTPYDPQSQRDPLYQGVQLGRCAGVTIGGAGCFITVAAMMTSHYLGKVIQPDVVNRRALEGGWYIDGCLYPDDMLARLVPGLQVEGVFNYAGIPADTSKLAMADDEEVLIVVDFDHNPNDGIQTHALRAFSWDGRALVVDDPWFGSRENFAAHYGTDLRTTIQKIVRYKLPGFVPPWKQSAGPAPNPAPPPPPAPGPPPPTPAPAPAPPGPSRQEFDALAAKVGNIYEFLQGLGTAWDKLA